MNGNEMKNIAFGASTVIAAIISYLFGNDTKMLVALAVIMGLDYLSGVAAAIYNKELSSKKGLKGILKKVAMLIAVALAHIIDVNILKQGDILMVGAIITFIANDGISILENIGKMGIKTDNKIFETLVQLKNKTDK